jgi:hypothetical protein
MELVKREDIFLRTEAGRYMKEPDELLPGLSKFNRVEGSDIDYTFDDGKFNYIMFIYNVEGYDTYIHEDKQFKEIIVNLIDHYGLSEEIKEQSSLFVGIYQDDSCLDLVFSPMSTCEGDDVDKPLPLIQMDNPLEIVFKDEKELAKFVKGINSRVKKCPAKPLPETHVLFTRDRMSIHDIMAQIYTGDISLSAEWTQEEIDFLETLNSGELYPTDYFKDKGFTPRRLVIMESTLEIPIFEAIAGRWVFYRHNYEANRGIIKIKGNE